MISITLLLTSAGADTGPFSLYSNVDSYVTPFEIGVNKATLQSGYGTTAPDGTTTVRIKSTSALCTNFIDVVLVSQYTFNWDYVNGPSDAPQTVYKITVNGTLVLDLSGYLTSQSGSFNFSANDSIYIETQLTAYAEFYNRSELGLQIADNSFYSPAIVVFFNDAAITDAGNETKYADYTKLPSELWNSNIWCQLTTEAFPI